MDQDSFLYPKSQEQYHKNLMTLATQVEKLTEALKKKKSNSDPDSSQLKQLDSKLQALVSQNDVLNQSVQNKQLQIEQLNLRIQVLDQAYMEGNMRLQESNTNLAVLQGRNRQLEGDLQSSQLIFQQKMNEYNNLLNSYRQMNDTIQKLREENRQLKDRPQVDLSSQQDVSNKEKENETIHRNYRKLLEEKQKEIDDLSFAKKFANDEWAKARNDNDQLKRELELAKKDAERNARQSLSVMSLQEEARLKFELGAKYEEEERNLRKRLEDKDIQMEELKQQIYQLKAKIQNQQNEFSQQVNQSQSQSQPRILEEHYNQMYQRCQRLIQELEEKDKKIIFYQGENEKLIDKINQLLENEANLKTEIDILRERYTSVSQPSQGTQQQSGPPLKQQQYLSPQQQQPRKSSPPRLSGQPQQFMPETSSFISPFVQQRQSMAPGTQVNAQRLSATPSMPNLQPQAVRYSQQQNKNLLVPPQQQMYQRK